MIVCRSAHGVGSQRRGASMYWRAIGGLALLLLLVIIIIAATSTAFHNVVTAVVASKHNLVVVLEGLFEEEIRVGGLLARAALARRQLADPLLLRAVLQGSGGTGGNLWSDVMNNRKPEARDRAHGAHPPTARPWPVPPWAAAAVRGRAAPRTTC